MLFARNGDLASLLAVISVQTVRSNYCATKQPENVVKRRTIIPARPLLAVIPTMRVPSEGLSVETIEGRRGSPAIILAAGRGNGERRSASCCYPQRGAEMG
jgi:hypothetical protein